MQEEDHRSQLYHHGVRGMKWGVRKGPPYPLSGSKRSVSEKQASQKKSLTNRNNNSLISIGKNKVNSMLNKMTGSADDLKFDDETIRVGKAAVDSMMSQKTVDMSKGIRKLSKSESLDETLEKANPLRGTKEGENNCVLSAIAGFLRQTGYDVTAGSSGGKPMNPAGVVEECFKGAKILEGSAVKFGKSRQDAAEMLVKRYGQNAEGICGIQWRGNGRGHTFNWKINDGVVSFFDSQQGKGDEYVSRYFSLIDQTGNLTLARLDNLEINMDIISKYVK